MILLLENLYFLIVSCFLLIILFAWKLNKYMKNKKEFQENIEVITNESFNFVIQYFENKWGRNTMHSLSEDTVITVISKKYSFSKEFFLEEIYYKYLYKKLNDDKRFKLLSLVDNGDLKNYWSFKK